MSATRKAKRAATKRLYGKFKTAWKSEKEFQRVMANKEVPRLGKRPTFSEWLDVVKTAAARAQATPEEVQDFKDEIAELGWDEEEKA